ncbi:MAG: Omp28-related outer membrane protein [Flavobacteriales bacterium]|nr:Omp28-related outer membrane protein [Flavobacteriales bacterium]
MKKLLLGVAAMTSFAAFAQLPVSTAPENRNVVLEEFTGINCPWCPDGHKLANQYAAANPGDVFLINIHTGGFANPGSGQPNYTTSFGAAIAGQTNLTGYPSGTINRQDFSPTYSQNTSGTAMNRSDWDDAGDLVLNDSSYVNLAVEGTIDVAAQTLTVDVELFYTGDGAPQNKLNVAVLQNGVPGPQVGAATLYPEMLNPDGTYNHMHMLRHLMAGQWGDDIDTTDAGTLVSRSYTWNIPASINGVPVDLSNLEIVAFVAEGQQFIVSGVDGPIDFVNFPFQTNARVLDVSSEQEVCALELNPQVTVQNWGGDTLTSIEFSYDVNGSGAMTYTWTGQLAPLASATASLPTISFMDNGTNTLNVYIISTNGSADQNASDNIGSIGSIVQNSGLGNLRLIMRQDRYGEEITWRIRNEAGQIVESGGPYQQLLSNGTQDHIHVLNLTDVECHRLEVLDSYGDGINSGYGNGKYWIEQADLIRIIEGDGVYTASIDHPFDYTATVGIEEEALSGVELYPNPTDELTTLSIELAGNDDVTYTVVNALGQVMATATVSGTAGINNIELNTSNWETGLYYINLEYNGQQSVEKLNVIH